MLLRCFLIPLVALMLSVSFGPRLVCGQPYQGHPYASHRISGIPAWQEAGTADNGAELFEGERSETEQPDEEGEEEEEVATDRDSFTPSTRTAPAGRWIFESAYSFIDNRNVPETHSYPEIVWRFGLTENVELRLGWNYEIGGAGSPISGNVPSDLEEVDALEEESRLLYGGKFYLTRQCRWTPESALIVQGFTPTSGESKDTQFSATHVFGWELGNRWVFDVGNRFGTSAFAGDDFNVWSPSTALKIPMGERINLHGEYFGVFTDGRDEESTQHFISPGIHFLVRPNLEIGTRLGWGLNEQAPNFFCNVGIGWLY